MTMNAVRIAFSKKRKNFLLPVVQHSIGFQRDERWGTTLAEWHRSACKAPRAWRELGSRITKSHGWPPVNNTQYSSSEKNVLSKERKIRRENSTNLIVKEKALINKIESETQKRINCFPTVLVTFDFASCGSLYQKSFVFTYSLSCQLKLKKEQRRQDWDWAQRDTVKFITLLFTFFVALSRSCAGAVKIKFTEKGDARLLPKSIANLSTTTTATAAETKINKQIFAQF